MKIRSIVVVITSAVLISIIANAGQAQTRSGLNAPKELLDVLDKEDRDCVVTNGGLSKSVRVQAIQLAADHSRQILVRGSGLCLCGAQNCGFWIYRKTGNRYELLLKGTGSTKVRAGEKSAKGYRDVISESHASANETILRTYRYDGSQYQVQSCVNRAYYDDNGKYVKKPIDRPCEGETKSQTYLTVPASVLEQELTTIDNRTLKLADYSDRIIIVGLFASWCAPCLMMIPDLDKISKSHGNRLQIIGVVTHEADPQIDSVRRFTSTLSVTFPVAWENIGFSESLSRSVNGPGAISAIPQIFVIDKEGRIRKFFKGYNRANTMPLLRAELHKIEIEEFNQPTKTP
jgi:thiol-disulfide isomerase/thioredoxin